MTVTALRKAERRTGEKLDMAQKRLQCFVFF